MRLFTPFPCWTDSWRRWPQQRQKNKLSFFLSFSQVHMGVCREGVTVGVCSSYTFIPAHLQCCITCWGQVIIWQNHCSPDYILVSPAPQPNLLSKHLEQEKNKTTTTEKAMGCVQSFRNLCDRPKNTNIRISLPAVCFVWQIAMIILFGVFIRYDEESDTHWIEHRKKDNISSDIENDFYFRYPSKWQFPQHASIFIISLYLYYLIFIIINKLWHMH